MQHYFFRIGSYVYILVHSKVSDKRNNKLTDSESVDNAIVSTYADVVPSSQVLFISCIK